MTETHTNTRPKVKGSLYKPPAQRPEETNLDLLDYIEDAKGRWQIHLYEWDEFSGDVVNVTKKAIDWSVVNFPKAVAKIKESYDKLTPEETKPVE